MRRIISVWGSYQTMFKRYLYTVAFNVLIPLFVLNLWWRSRKNAAYRQRIEERFGYVAQRSDTERCLWVHAVSVGEVIAAKPLIERLRHEYPHATLWITTTTPTGSAMVKRLFGEYVRHSYCPYDLPNGLNRFIRRVRPSLLMVIETEIWPNLYHACATAAIPLLMVNARLSARSYKGYARFDGLIRDTLQEVNWIGARSAADAEHFRQLGAPPQRISVCGNLKFALQIPDDLRTQAAVWRQQWGNRPVWVAGSTHANEEESLLRVFAQLRESIPDLLLILVPRHPERFAAVKTLCTHAGWEIVSRSSAQPVLPSSAILLGDTLGELLQWYACADLAFVGGSLIAHGGHNPLEAAAFGIPVISGEHTHNFTDIYPELVATGGAVLVADETALYTQTLDWLQQPALRQHAGQQALAFFKQQQGILDSILQHVHLHLDAPNDTHDTPLQTIGY